MVMFHMNTTNYESAYFRFDYRRWLFDIFRLGAFKLGRLDDFETV